MEYRAPSLLRRAGGKRADGIEGLVAEASDYLPEQQVEQLRRAYEFGAEAHAGQTRVSGEPYITHPVAVARILAELRLDAPTLIAAILHDVLEDTPKSKQQVIDGFGEEVAELVDGVSKLTHLKFKSRAEAQAENFRKMLLAMVQDIRVILVKLADRLHNMRTLGAMPSQKRRRIARETLDIYAPIANRLGINAIRLELENLGFMALHPMRHRVFERRLKRNRGTQKALVKKITQAVGGALGEAEIEGRVEGREKHLYSIYKKMMRKRLPLIEVLDVYGFRVVVDNVDNCYRVLGLLHSLFRPVPGRFKDYIAIPKANGYQSLHTGLVGPDGAPVEVQIRTEEMDRVAESGIAAHWLYKADGSEARFSPTKAREWLAGVLDMGRGASSMEFLENVKVDLFPEEVYVFTPRGDIMRLPRGATAVDFAYAVHTDVGDATVACKIDRRLVPLRSQLVNGQTVEVVTAKGATPNPAWLNFVVTAKARANIRGYLKKLEGAEAIALGKRLLERALSEYGSSIRKLSTNALTEMLKDLNLKDRNQLFEHIGLGKRLAPLVARRLMTPGGKEDEEAAPAKQTEGTPLSIKGTEGMVVTFGRCCRPIPGDGLQGFLSAGRGIVVHRDNCRNLAEYRNQPDAWIDVEWEPEPDRSFSAAVRVDVDNEPGALATVAAHIGDLGSNIEQVNVMERDGRVSTLDFVIAVHDRDHLAKVMRSLRRMRQTLKVARV
jgi:GTP pyrophosphokinase